jgi:hypothetical protein
MDKHAAPKRRQLFTSQHIVIIIAIELSLSGSSPYTSTNKTNKNKYI